MIAEEERPRRRIIASPLVFRRSPSERKSPPRVRESRSVVPACVQRLLISASSVVGASTVERRDSGDEGVRCRELGGHPPGGTSRGRTQPTNTRRSSPTGGTGGTRPLELRRHPDRRARSSDRCLGPPTVRTTNRGRGDGANGWPGEKVPVDARRPGRGEADRRAHQVGSPVDERNDRPPPPARCASRPTTPSSPRRPLLTRQCLGGQSGAFRRRPCPCRVTRSRPPALRTACGPRTCEGPCPEHLREAP